MKKTSLKLIYFVVACWSIPAYSQEINTIAGGGASFADSVLATTANIGLFGNITVDFSGNVYIALNSKVRKIDQATGIITTIAGTGTVGYNGDGIAATSAQVCATYVVADKSSNLYINDGNNWRIRKIDAITGIITTVAGTGVAGYNGDGIPATTAQISDGTQGIAVDDLGNLYLNDGGSDRIRKVDATGIITTIAGTGAATNTGDGGPATSATVDGMFGICTDVTGNVYFTSGAGSVRKINVTTGIITRVAGMGDDITSPYSGDGLPATNVHMGPYGIALDSNNIIYIADYNNSRVEMVDTFGIIHTIAGTGVSGFSGDGGSATAAKISYPENLSLDACNNVYIADFNNQRARKVTYPPTAITLSNAITTLITTVCAGTPTTYTAAATTSNGTITYQWYVNGTPITGATASTYNYTPADADSIRCIATATSPCTSAVTSSNSIIMSVTPVTTPTITVTAPAAAPVGSTVTVNATVVPIAIGSYSINWYNNSTLLSTTAAPTTTYTKPAGTDHITATILPGEGCYDSTTSAPVTVDASTTGVRNTSSPSERPGEVIFPNPAHNTITITAQHLANISITNLLGQTMLSKDYNADHVTINIETLPAGIYTLKTTTTEGEKTITKIVKQ